MQPLGGVAAMIRYKIVFPEPFQLKIKSAKIRIVFVISRSIHPVSERF